MLRGSLYRAVLSAETVWTLEDGELMLMLAKSDKVLWSPPPPHPRRRRRRRALQPLNRVL